QDTVVYRDFPSMLAHRMHDEKLVTPMREFDLTPPVGRVGTGVQVDDIVTTHEVSPATINTGNLFDMAIEGIPGVARSYGFFEVLTPQGKMYTRAGNFIVNSEGYLATQAGALVLGENGPVKVDASNIRFEPDGRIITNPTYTGEGVNLWQDPVTADALRLVSFENVHGLEKVGYTLFRATDESGPPQKLLFGTKLRTGMLEQSNVNLVREMIDLIKSQRAYETSAKVVQTHDTLLGQAVNDVGRVG
ncbi:MAG: flagellar hook-basal body protein, partial [Candidatus Hydrogenedentota bacterium]